MARRPKPDELHELEGTKNRANRTPVKPTPLDSLPEEIPDYLTDSGASAYIETVRALNGLGIGSQADLGVVEAYSLALGMMRDASEDIRIHGLSHVDDRGVSRRNPAVTALNQSQSQIRQLAPLLGLSPTARAGLEITRLPRKGDDESFLSEWENVLEGN